MVGGNVTSWCRKTRLVSSQNRMRSMLTTTKGTVKRKARDSTLVYTCGNALYYTSGTGFYGPLATRLFLIAQSPFKPWPSHHRDHVPVETPEEPQIRPSASVDIWSTRDIIDGNFASPSISRKGANGEHRAMRSSERLTSTKAQPFPRTNATHSSFMVYFRQTSRRWQSRSSALTHSTRHDRMISRKTPS